MKRTLTVLAVALLAVSVYAAGNRLWPSWIDHYKGLGYLGFWYDGRTDATTLTAEELTVTDVLNIPLVETHEAAGAPLDGQVRIYGLQSTGKLYLRRWDDTYDAIAIIASTTDATVRDTWSGDPRWYYTYTDDAGDQTWARFDAAQVS